MVPAKKPYRLPGLDKDMPSEKMLHYTFIFQIFVFIQVFNLINSRKIAEDEINVFAGFFDNFLFVFVIFATIGVQMALVEVGGKFSKTTELDTKQNLICLGISLLTLVWGFILKFTGYDFWLALSTVVELDCTREELEEHQKDDDDEEGEAKPVSMVASFKKSVAKSASQKSKEKEIQAKIKQELVRRMSSGIKGKLGKLNSINN
jgi:Ca2+ transporting ATPase